MRPAVSRASLGAMLAGAAVGACSSTGPQDTGRIVFQIATTDATVNQGPATADVVVNAGADQIVINKVELVARKIRLEQTGAACEEEDADDEGEAENEHEDEEEDEDCPTLKVGPVLLVPPLNDGAQTTFTVDVPVGSYKELELQIHKPRGSKDQAFLALHPDFDGVSIRVTGTFNGAPFTFTTDLTAEEEVELSPPIVVTTGGSTEFTLFLDVRKWFVNQAGTALINPASSSESDKDRIEQNIRNSFEAFEDEDHDGHEDHDDH